MEVIEHHEKNSRGEDVDEGSLNPDFPGAVKPHVSADATRYMEECLPLAVMSPYLRIGNTFMKLRLNIANIYNHTTLLNNFTIPYNLQANSTIKLWQTSTAFPIARDDYILSITSINILQR